MDICYLCIYYPSIVSIFCFYHLKYINLCIYLSSIFIIYFLLSLSMYYLLMIYFSIFNIYYLLPISHPLSMELPFIFIIHHLSFIYYLSVVYYLSTLLLSISHLYLCPPPFYLPTIYVSILYHLCISIICLSVCPYVGLVVEPCLTHA